MNATRAGKSPIGLAVVGCGSIGAFRSTFASNYPGVEWIGLCDIDEKKGKKLASDIGADFFTTDYNELLSRSEVNAVIISTEENEHVGPIHAALESGNKPRLLLEKPLATSAVESAKILNIIQDEGLDAVVGYTQRFRRKYLVVKQQILDGHLGNTTSAVTRAFMNGWAPFVTVTKTEYRTRLTPMVVSGTHSLDLSFWLFGDKKPVEIYAHSIDTTLAGLGTKDATFGIFTFDDNSMLSMNISWALPKVWPAATFTIELGIVGTKGVITVDDTHRDLVMATEDPHPTHRTAVRPDMGLPEKKNVSFLASYPPGDMVMGQLWGAMREETGAWFSRLYTGAETPHATAAEGHRNLMMTMAMDHSAKTGKAVSLPISPEELDE